MAKSKEPPKPLAPEDSRVESLHRGQEERVQRAIGRIDDEDTVTLTAPSPIKRGAKAVPRGAVGLRAATPRSAPSPKALDAVNTANERVRSQRDDRRQKVWDKLDSARKSADEKKPRFSGFEPKRPPK